MGTTRRAFDSITALIPAAGRARRLGPLPFSKELLPVGFGGSPHQPRPRLACHGLLASLEHAGVHRALMIVRPAKMDIPRHLAIEPPPAAPPLGYVVLDDSASLPETLRRGLPLVRRDTIALGFPDILFTPENAFSVLLEDHRRSGADLTLGLFPTPSERRPSTDMVRLAADGEVLEIEVRPRDSAETFNWLLAVWEPTVSERILEAGACPPAGEGGDNPRAGEEPQLGTLFERLRRDGARVRGVPFPGGSYEDLGTPGAWLRRLGECPSGGR